MLDGRRGDWIQTASGRQFWPMAPRADEVHIEDIAHALSMLCRFGGHVREFYSVAEHSVYVARHVTPEHRLWALLHDASEAYLVDVPRPIKPFLGGYLDAERRIMAVVCERFGLPPEMPADVKDVDDAILIDEREQIMARPPVDWKLQGERLGVFINCWSPDEARLRFLSEFEAAMRLPVPHRCTD